MKQYRDDINPPKGPVREHPAREGARVDLDTHLTDLRRRHRELDAEIQIELRQCRPNDPLVKCLKRQKLRLMARIAASSGPQMELEPPA